MKILLVNDDGIEAAGLAITVRLIAKHYPEAEIVIYAPDRPLSGAGRSMTFGNGKTVRVEELGTGRFKVFGTPADCVEIACRCHAGISLIFSGINHGWNLGEDFYLSGTIQAACHGLDYFSIPAVALSAPKESMLDGTAEALAEPIIAAIAAAGHHAGLININLPAHGDEPRLTRLGTYRAIGGLTLVTKNTSIAEYDLLGPMSEMAASADDCRTDVGAVTKGFISVNLRGGACFSFNDKSGRRITFAAPNLPVLCPEYLID